MDVSSVGSLTTALTPTQVSEEAGMLVLRKVLDQESQGVLQLLQSVAPVSSNPPNLGNSVDVKV